jgi:hypothetical protein
MRIKHPPFWEAPAMQITPLAPCGGEHLLHTEPFSFNRLTSMTYGSFYWTYDIYSRCHHSSSNEYVVKACLYWARNVRHSLKIKMNTTGKLCALNCLYTKWGMFSEWIKMQIQSWHSYIIITKGMEPSTTFCENQPTDSKVTQEIPRISQFQKIHYPKHRSFPLVSYFRFSYQDFVWISLLSYVWYMFHSLHPPWFYHSNNILQRVQIMKLLIKQFSYASCYLIHLRSKCSPQHTILKYPQFYVFLLLWEKNVHTHTKIQAKS